jgi:hypothetical protein
LESRLDNGELISCWDNFQQHVKFIYQTSRSWRRSLFNGYSNLKEYDEASRCYLQTLALNEDATQCWSYLRLSVTCAERWELLEAATRHELEPFEKVFDFVRENNG